MGWIDWKDPRPPSDEAKAMAQGIEPQQGPWRIRHSLNGSWLVGWEPLAGMLEYKGLPTWSGDISRALEYYSSLNVEHDLKRLRKLGYGADVVGQSE